MFDILVLPSDMVNHSTSWLW